MTQESAPGNAPEFSVSELARALKQTVETAFGMVRVRAEVSQPKLYASGHLYLRLKDQDAVLEAVCWRGQVSRLAVMPEDGMEVICTGRLTTYPGRSQYQLVIESCTLAGVGALMQLLEARRKKLAAEGLFDAARKRALPALPAKIGVITSAQGAVLRDILHRLRERMPSHVLLWPVAVQGDKAAAQIVTALEEFNKLPGALRPDVLIIARGGGSFEDLLPFSEEAVVRAAVASSLPVISAIGHETDTCLLDLAADLRAPTPTAAAEMAVPVRADLQTQLAQAALRRQNALHRVLEERRLRVAALARGLGDPRRHCENLAQRLDERAVRLHQALRQFLGLQRQRHGALAARLSARLLLTGQDMARTRLAHAAQRLAPAIHAQLERARVRLSGAGRLLALGSVEQTLARGFALALDASGKVITHAESVKDGAGAKLRFQDGERDIRFTAPPTQETLF